MGEQKTKLEKVIPQDYSMLKIRSIGNEILEIGVIKVRNNQCVTKYVSLVQPEDEEIKQTLHYKDITYKELDNIDNIDTAITTISNIIGTDTIIYLNSNEQLEILKSKCENLEIPLNNHIISGRELSKQIPADLKFYVCNTLEVLTLF